MCGIVGGYREAREGFADDVRRALVRLRHRGPDDSGMTSAEVSNGIVALGHTRLSIIDLSAAGRQPMISDDGRFEITFNGEIYNYHELRSELSNLGRDFKTRTDTEVLLQAWVEWGPSCLPKLVGMFAFAIYDKVNAKLICVRDAFGIKPLFYSFSNEGFTFASELPALSTMLPQIPSIDWQRSYDYLVHSDYDSDIKTFVDGVEQLRPAHYLEFDITRRALGSPQQWWAPQLTSRSGLSFADAADGVRTLFLDNVRLHMRSDVPIGAALSGGVDSAAVVCAMRHIEKHADIHTFSYIANEAAISEEHWVDLVNGHVGANVHKVRANAEDLARDMDAMLEAQGEPFGSTSIYAQYRVFRAAREAGIVVTLDGQGADELLAGYSGYPGNRIHSLFEEGGFLEAIRFARQWSRWPGRRYRDSWLYFAQIICPESVVRLGRTLAGRDYLPSWINKQKLIDHGVKFRAPRYRVDELGKGRRVVERLINSVQIRALPGLLRHADRNSMHFSIESRVPFLTVPFAEFLFSLPEEYLISPSGETKSVFRAAMRGIVPDEILDRKDKIGFATPEKSWLLDMQGQIGRWLLEAPIDLIDQSKLIERFDQVIRGDATFNWQLWRWINFTRWHKHAIDSSQ